MNEAQEQVLINTIEGISWDLRRLTDKLAPATETSHKNNRYHIARRHSREKYWCDCRFDFFRHTLQGFECHRCLKFHSLDDYVVCTDPMRLELC